MSECPEWCDPQQCTATTELVQLPSGTSTVVVGAHVGTPAPLGALTGQPCRLSWSLWQLADDDQAEVMAEVRLVSPERSGEPTGMILERDDLPGLAAVLLEVHAALKPGRLRQVAC